MSVKIGDKVWIKIGRNHNRIDEYPSPMLVEIIVVHAFPWFTAIPIDKNMKQVQLSYCVDEIVKLKSRKANFIGGAQRFQ